MMEKSTEPFAEVIGDPIAQSKSPLIHGFWLKRLGLAARYGARRVTIDSLSEYLAARRQDHHWLGCNVTMPLKQSILPLLDEIEPIARQIGAVNTVLHTSDGRLLGTNTDAAGFSEPLQRNLEERHLFRMARIFGSGGAARAIINALYQHWFTLVVAARNQSKARALLDELAPEGEHYTAPLGHFAKPTDFPFDDRDGCLDLVINASPLGMRGAPPLGLDLTHVPPGSVIYDIVTDPVETPLLIAAREAGLATIDGLSMLIGQAAIAFERFYGAPPPREHDAALRELLTE